MKIPKVLTISFVLCCLFVGQVFADIDSCLEITKEADCAYSQVGDTINYTITIENCGEGQFILLDVVDTLLGPLPECLGAFLPPDESCTVQVPYIVQVGDLNPLVNEVTVTALDLLSGEPFSETAATEVRLVNPDFTLDVECINEPDGLVNGNGGTALFQVCVANTGDVPLDVEVQCLGLLLPLGPGEQYCEIVQPLPEGAGPCGAGGVAEFTCCATATIPPEYCDVPNVIERCDTDICETPPVNPDFTLDVECVDNPDGIVNNNGGTALFQVCIANTGDVPLDVQTECFVESLNSPLPTLDPGQEVCVFVEVPLDGVGPCGTGGVAELTCCATATIPPEYCDLPYVLERCDSDICETPPCEPTLSVDIKPTSCPNPLRARGKGVLPVAILGTEDFDVTTIDVLTITLAGVSPIRSSFEDVATPLDKEDECECTTEGPDGYLDLTLKFDKRQIVEALGDLSLLPRRSVIPLTLRGKLMDNDVLILEGTDCIVFLNLRQR